MEAKCPGCGATVLLRGATSVFTVCSHCQATIIRNGVTLEQIGSVAIVDESWSPIQMSTSGDYKGAKFIVAGRVRQRWERGVWNEWNLAFNDGTQGWLCEAQGFYGITRPVESAAPLLQSLTVGESINLAKNTFAVQDIKSARCDFFEGELPFRAEIGREVTTVDLTGRGNIFASIEYSADGARTFVGSYEPFEALDFINLRQTDGW